MSSYTWTVDADGDWSTLTNWNPSGPPATGQDVVIDTADFHTITHSSGIDFIGNLTLGNDELLLSGGSSLKVEQSFAATGTVDITSGIFDVAGSGQSTGAVTVGSSGSLEVEGALSLSGTNHLAGSVDLTVHGTLSLSGSNGLEGSIHGPGTLAIDAGSAYVFTSATLTMASFDIAGAGTDFSLEGNFGTLDYAGDLTLSSSATLALGLSTLKLSGVNDLDGAITGLGTLQILTGTTTLDDHSGFDADVLIVSAGTVSITGSATVGSGVQNGGTVQNNGTIRVEGTLVDTGTFSGTGTLDISGGTVELTGTVSGATVDFTAGGLLVLGSANGVTVGDFTNGDAINLQSVTYAGGETASYAAGSHQLIVYETGSSVAVVDVNDLTLAGGYHLTVTDDNGTAGIIETPCFLAGTRILTERGEVAVEDLAISDRVVTLSGRGPVLKPIKWLGRRRIDARRHPRPDTVHPVRIGSGAVAEGVPHRDLLVSPGHAIYVEGVLIPAERLVNGMSIIQDRDVAAIVYFHVELDSHDILLAEGLPAESYLDSGNRDFFETGGLPVALHGEPDRERVRADRCVKLIARSPAAAAIRQRLADRAQMPPLSVGPIEREG